MKMTSKSIVNGYFKDEIGKRSPHIFKGKKPNYSFQLSWEDLPKNTASLALIFIDHDAIPVCGFSWIHWLVANIDPSLKELPENASATLSLLQGITSWSSPLLPEEGRLRKEEDIGYGGCAPPDREHLYTIKLYALDDQLHLPSGFLMNDLLKAMKGHILDKCLLEALYKN